MTTMSTTIAAHTPSRGQRPRVERLRLSTAPRVGARLLRTMLALALAAFVLLLAACGGTESPSNQQTAASTSSESSADPSKSPSPTASGEPLATPEQYASVIARQGRLVKQLQEMSRCDWLGSGPLYRPGYIVCAVGTLSLQYGATTLQLELQNAQDPSRPHTYIGKPPAELAALVRETTDMARALEQAMKSMPARCNATHAGACQQKRILASLSIDDMQRTLAAWRPYL